jgi:hypothetical protein
LVIAGVVGVEVCCFQRVVDVFFVVFGYVEDEWPEPRVVVVAVLFPCGCSADGDYDAFAGFADFYGGRVNSGDCGFLVVWFERYRRAFELQV